MALLTKPIELGTLFDDLADRGHATTVHLSRPLDIAPGLGTVLNIPGLAGLVREIAGWFAAAGVRRGDRVAIAKRNHWDYVLLNCAAARIGAVPASLSAHLAPDVLGTLLKRLEPALVVVDSALLAASREAGTDPACLATRTLVVDGAAEGALSLDEVRGHTVPPAYRPPADDPLAIMHTSGTTGVPKLVVHSTRTIMRRLAGFEAHRWPVLGSRPGDTVASAISFAHGRALAQAASVLWLAPAKFLAVCAPDWGEAGPFLDRHRPTTLEALPATYVRWQRRSRGAGRSVRTGPPLHQHLRRHASAHRARLPQRHPAPPSGVAAGLGPERDRPADLPVPHPARHGHRTRPAPHHPRPRPSDPHSHPAARRGPRDAATGAARHRRPGVLPDQGTGPRLCRRAEPLAGQADGRVVEHRRSRCAHPHRRHALRGPGGGRHPRGKLRRTGGRHRRPYCPRCWSASS